MHFLVVGPIYNDQLTKKINIIFFVLKDHATKNKSH